MEKRKRGKVKENNSNDLVQCTFYQQFAHYSMCNIVAHSSTKERRRSMNEKKSFVVFFCVALCCQKGREGNFGALWSFVVVVGFEIY